MVADDLKKKRVNASVKAVDVIYDDKVDDKVDDVT
jgi:hypothetical protein